MLRTSGGHFRKAGWDGWAMMVDGAVEAVFGMFIFGMFSFRLSQEFYGKINTSNILVCIIMKVTMREKWYCTPARLQAFVQILARRPPLIGYNQLQIWLHTAKRKGMSQARCSFPKPRTKWVKSWTGCVTRLRLRGLMLWSFCRVPTLDITQCSCKVIYHVSYLCPRRTKIYEVGLWKEEQEASKLKLPWWSPFTSAML